MQVPWHDFSGDVAVGTLPVEDSQGAMIQLSQVQVPCVTYFDVQLQILDLLEHRAGRCCGEFFLKSPEKVP